MKRFSHCQQCGISLKGLRGKKYCSRRCSSEHQKTDPEFGRISSEQRRQFFQTEAGKQQAQIASDRMKTKNPMLRPEVVEKAMKSRRLNGTLDNLGEKRWTGKGLTIPQLLLFQALDWLPEKVIKTKKVMDEVPHFYRVDLAHPSLSLAIEVDGIGHNGDGRRLDRKKEACLKLLGWKVFRVTNKEVLADFDLVLSRIDTWVKANEKGEWNELE